MKIVYNNFIPLKGFKAITLWPWIFVRKGKKMNNVDIRHEEIHGEQQKELLIVFFYLLYAIFYVIEIFRCLFNKSRGVKPNKKKQTFWNRVYRSVPFENEAYSMEHWVEYLEHREHYAWVNFI